MFLTYPMPKFYVGDKELFRNFIRDVRNLKYDVAYYEV